VLCPHAKSDSGIRNGWLILLVTLLFETVPHVRDQCRRIVGGLLLLVLLLGRPGRSALLRWAGALTARAGMAL
jgi:hypothetical protein